MNTSRLAILILAGTLAGLAQARPVVLEETATLTRPNASWQYFGRFGVAIDGDYALVSGERFVEDPAAEGGTRHEGVVFVYQRSGTSWNHIGRLGPVSTIAQWNQPGFAMKDGVAVTWIGITRIFERRGTTWAAMPLSADLENNLQGPDIEIDGGRILISRKGCNYQSVVLRKINGSWSIEGELVGNQNFCTNVGAQQDLQGTRAIVHNPSSPDTEGQPAELETTIQYQLNDNSVGWRRTTLPASSSSSSFYGPHLALNWPNWAIAGERRRGTLLLYDFREFGAVAYYGLQPADSYLTPTAESTQGIERFRDLFAQRNWSHDRNAYVVNLFRVNDDEVRSSEHVATLQTANGASLGNLLDTSGNRIIVSGWFNFSGNNSVRVFEVPETLDTPAVQVYNFDLASDGAAWQPAAGSTFTVSRAGNTGVYRQPSTAGTPSSSLPSSHTTNQAIQVEVTPRAVNGANAWVGLTTRRSDDANYYYVTLRASGSLELKSLVNGAITTLNSAGAAFNIGQKYRLRLESIGTVHRVFLNDRQIMAAHDDTHGEGTVGVITNRASADFDNVIVTPSPFTTIDAHDFSSSNLDNWNPYPGIWTFSEGVYHQTYMVDYGRSVTGALTDDQIVQARIRPVQFAGPDNWVGLMARYRDDHNYLYVSLRARGVISLWRRQTGVLTQLAQIRYPFAAGSWYTMRLEVVGERTRVYMNDQLLLSSNADPGPENPNVEWKKGLVGLITYKATAEFDDFLAYEP